MFRDIVGSLRPSGATVRRSYQAALLGFLALFAGLILATGANLVPDWAAVVAILPAFVALFLLTIRRLRDAGLSVYWAGLMIFPLRIPFDSWSMQLGFAEFQPFDVTALLGSLPILIAIVARERGRARDTGEPSADAAD